MNFATRNYDQYLEAKEENGRESKKRVNENDRVREFVTKERRANEKKLGMKEKETMKKGRELQVEE